MQSVIIIAIIVTMLVEFNSVFAEPQIETSTMFDEGLNQMTLTLKGTGFYPDLPIGCVVIHDIGIEFTIARCTTHSDANGNFFVSSPVSPLSETGTYIVRVIDVERHNFKEKLIFEDFPEEAIDWKLSPKKFTVGEPTVIDISGLITVDTDHNREIMIRVDQLDHKWSAVGERVKLTDDDRFHFAKTVNFRTSGEHVVVIEYNGLVRQSSFDVFLEHESQIDPPSLQLDSPPSDESQKIPEWVKNTMKWFVEGKISEDEMINALQFLIREGIIRV